MNPSVVNAGDDVMLRCSIQFGAPSNTFTTMTSQQFPRLTMTFGDVELTTATPQNTEGQPAHRPYRLRRVSTLVLFVCFIVAYANNAGSPHVWKTWICQGI